MECPKCLIKYRADNSKTPRILGNCGHSFCELCLNLLHDKESQKITCSICNTETRIDDVKNLIKNMALLESSISKKLEIFSDFKRRDHDHDENIFSIHNHKNNPAGNYFQKINHLNINNIGAIESCIYRSSTPNLSDSKAFSNSRKPQQKNKSITQCLNFGNAHAKSFLVSNKCAQHSKPLEAFCNMDKSLLCVSCILENDHKNHDLTAIGKAAQAQKDLIEANLLKISEKEKKINDEITLIENHMKNSKYDSDEKIKNIENFFKKIYLLVSFREEFLKAKVTNQFDFETEKTLFYRKNLEDKLKLVEQIKQEKENLTKLSDLEILALTKEREKLFENVLLNSFSSSDNFYINNDNEESLSLNGINVSNGNANLNNNKLNSNENFISPKLEKINFYNLCANQENEINYLIKLMKSLIKRDLFDQNFLENFEINKQKITTNYVEINLERENKDHHKDFNINIFSDENLDKFANNIQENISTNRNSNGISGHLRIKSSSNSISNNNLKEIKTNYHTQQQPNNLGSSNQNTNTTLANSGKFTSLTNFGNNKLNDKLETKSEISNSNKNIIENKNEVNNKIRNNNYMKSLNNNFPSTAALEKRSTCFMNKEDIVNYENQVYKKLNEKETNAINNKQDKQQKDKENEKIKEKEKIMKKQLNSKKIYIMPNAIKKTTKQSSHDNKKTTESHSDNSFLNVKPEPKLEKPIISNNEILADISPVHPHEGSVYKIYDENITSFDSILDSSDNFHIPNNNDPKNKFTQHIADTKLHNLNSYANKEKEKELFKKSKLDSHRNFNNNQANSNNNFYTINKGIDLNNFNSNNNGVIGIKNQNTDNAQKGFIPLSKMEGKIYSKKSYGNTQQLMNSHKKAQSKVNCMNNANLNNSLSVIEINYNQNQTDEEEKDKNRRSKNHSHHSSRNNNDDNFKKTHNLIEADSLKKLKKSSTLNIDLYNEVIPKENIRKRSSRSKESSLVRDKDINKNAPESNSGNSQNFKKIKNIFPFGSNYSKNNSTGRKRLNNSNTEFNPIQNTSFNSNKNTQNLSALNQVTINTMGNNYVNFKEEIKLNNHESKKEIKNLALQIFQNNNYNVNSSEENIAKEGEIQTNMVLNPISIDTNKNILVIRGSRTDQPHLNNVRKEESNNPIIEKTNTFANQKVEDLQEIVIPKHKYNTSKDTGFLSITATEDYLDFINSNNTNIKGQNNTNNMIENDNLNLNQNLHREKEEIILSDEKANPDISAININNNLNENDTTSKIIGLDNNTSRSIFRHDFASLYNPYSSHILSLGGKSDLMSRKYSIETNTWTTIREMKVERSDFVALMYKEKRILIMGGKSLNYNGIESVSDTIDLLSIDGHNIVRLDFKLKIPRSNFGAVYHERKLFVAGGYNGRDALNNFEFFDKKTKKWVDLPKMFNKKKEFTMILGPDNNIYCLGGSDERELVLKSFEVYDIKKNSWTKLEEMNQCRKGLSAISMPDGIYAIGGYDGCQYLKSVEKYDFVSKRWEYIEDMNYSKCHFSCVSSSDYRYIYVLGGYDGKPMNIMERYDCLLSKWEVIEKLPTTKYRHQSIILNE